MSQSERIPLPSTIERIEGCAITQGAASVGAAGVALISPAVGLVAALVPPLISSEAGRRFQDRVRSALESIEGDLSKMQAQLDAFTDDQFKLVCEAVSECLVTADQQKLDFLRRAVRNAAGDASLVQGVAYSLARVLRALSAAEARFLTEHFAYDRVWVLNVEAGEQPYDGGLRVLYVQPGSNDDVVVGGLTSLGLLSPAEATWDQSGMLRFSPLVAKLLSLLRESSAPTSP